MATSELPIPPAASKDEHARELVRVWAAGGTQQVSLATGLWPDPGAWGILLVDLAKHAAKAYHLNQGFDEVVVLRRIRAVFEAEWGTPTDEPKGQLLDGKKPE